jgi:hypothetical protein
MYYITHKYQYIKIANTLHKETVTFSYQPMRKGVQSLIALQKNYNHEYYKM